MAKGTLTEKISSSNNVKFCFNVRDANLNTQLYSHVQTQGDQATQPA